LQFLLNFDQGVYPIFIHLPDFIYVVGGICTPVSGETGPHLTSGEMYDSIKNQWSITNFELNGKNVTAIAKGKFISKIL